MGGMNAGDDNLRMRALRIEAFFLRFEEQLRAALADAGDTHSLDDLWGLIWNNELLLTSNEHAFLIAELHTFPRRKHLHLWLGGAHPGHGQELHGLRENLEHFATQAGYSALTLAGRDGWAKALAGAGWRPFNRWLVRDVAGQTTETPERFIQ